MMGLFPINKEVQFAKWGKNKLKTVWLNFIINQNGSNCRNSFLWGKLTNIPVKITQVLSPERASERKEMSTVERFI